MNINQKGQVPLWVLWGVAVLVVAGLGVYAAPKIIENFKGKVKKETAEECLRRTGGAEECAKLENGAKEIAEPAKAPETSEISKEPAQEFGTADLIISNEEVGASAENQKQLCGILSGAGGEPKFEKAKSICAKYSAGGAIIE